MARTRDPKLDALAAHPLFARCTRRDLVTLGRLVERVTVPPGTTLVTAGEGPRWVYLVVDGQAEVRRGGRAEGVVGAGDAAGLAAAVAGRPQTATVVAVTPVDTFAVPARVLRDAVGISPTIATAVARALSDEVVALEARPRTGVVRRPAVALA